MKRIKLSKMPSQAALDRRIRRTWNVRPVTKVVPSGKLYSRKQKHKGSDGF